MTEIKIIVEKGSELSEQTMKEVNDLWDDIFSSPLGARSVNPENIETFSKDIFFMVKNENNELLSAGRLRPVSVDFLGKKYVIEGIADIASVVQRKGHGKTLMTAIKKYLEDNNELGIGFCNKKLVSFYEKCGYKIVPNIGKRSFVYENPNNEPVKEVRDNEVLYFNDNGLMKAVLEHPGEIVYIPVPHW